MRTSLTAMSLILLLGSGGSAFAQLGFLDGGRREDRSERRDVERRDVERRREFERGRETERQRAVEPQRRGPETAGRPGGAVVAPTGCPAGMLRRGNDCELRRR